MIAFLLGILCGSAVTVAVCAFCTRFFARPPKEEKTPKKFRYRQVGKKRKERSETDRLLEMIWF